MTFLHRSIRLFFSMFSPVFPRFTGKLALELFQRPHAKKTRSRELVLYEEFEEKRVPFEEEDLYIYEKGEEEHYPVILVHGWESNPGSMYGIAKKLLQSNFRVIIMGLPAHGKSDLKKTTMVHASEGIVQLLKSQNLSSGFSMITHSFGSGASTLALKNSGFKVDSLIFLTSPDRISNIFEGFISMISLGEKAAKHLILETEKMLGYSIANFNISDFLVDVKYSSVLIFHDKKDKVLPWSNAQNLKEKNPDVQLNTVHNKGHYRILWDDEIIGSIEEHLYLLRS